jgi:hypothetical protein
MRLVLLAWLALCATLAPSARALACGVSGPDGAWSCSLEEHEEELRPRWQLGAAGAYTSTALRFGEDSRAEQTRYAVVATGVYAPTRRLALQASAGVGFAGELRMDDVSYEFGAGPTVAAGVVYTLLEGRPFVALSGVLSAAFARTRAAGESAESYTALDLRAGLIAGTVLFDVLVPYAVVRVFGGPVFWQGDTGTDVYHYQLGAGLTLRPLEAWSISLEGVPLGEQALSAGTAIAF